MFSGIKKDGLGMYYNQAVIDEVITRVMDYVRERALEKYKNGQTNTIGLFARKKVIVVSIETYSGERSPGFTTYKTPLLYTGDPLTGRFRPFFSSLKKVCDSKGITVEDCYSGGNKDPYIKFTLPAENVASYFNDFSQKLKTNRHDLVIQFGNALLSNQSKGWIDIGLDKHGLTGYRDETGVPILAFASLGMKPLDNDVTVELFAKAIIDYLEQSKAVRFTIVKQSTNLGLQCFFKKEIRYQRKPQLSDW